MRAAQAYLVLYNVAQAAGWSAVLVRVAAHLLSPAAELNAFGAVQPALNLFQTMAALEVLHCAVGIVRAPVGTTAVQLTSRLAVVWLVANPFVEVQRGVGAVLFILAWSVTECIRYPYYACNLTMGAPPYALTWLRYTLFLVLYPMGVAGELCSIYTALPHIKHSGTLTLHMPRANVSFSLYYAVIIFALLYLPLFPQMYGYMLAQRRKILNGAPARSQQKKVE